MEKNMEKKLISQVLPDEIIIYDILTRVPPLSLIRFRCVCKYWCKLFPHNPLFVALHSQKYIKSASSGFISLSRAEHSADDDALVFIDHNNKKKTIIDLPLPTNWILRSFNGFLLLKCHSKDYNNSHSFCVYNPITRQGFNIPLPINDCAWEDSCDFRLCYDPVIGKHKVVFCGPYKRNSPLEKIKFLTIGEGLEYEDGGNNVSWSSVVVPSTFELTYNSLCTHYSSFCLNDSLYWIAGTYNCSPYVLGLNISKELLYRIKLPKASFMLKQNVHLTEMEGVLCLSHNNSIAKLKIWTLKKENHGYNEDDHIWVERFKIDFRHSMGNIHNFVNLDKVYDQLLPFAILTDPKLKIIFARVNTEQEYIYEYTYYSYDIELKQLQIIHGPRTAMDMPWYWHVHSIGNL